MKMNMRNRFTRFCVLVAILLEAGFTTPVLADNQATVDGVTFHYSINSDGTATLTDVLNFGSTLTIPAQLDGHNVVTIGLDCLYDDDHIDDIKTIIIPPTVTLIRDGAFDDDFFSTNELEKVVFLGAEGAGTLTINDDDSFKEATTVQLERNISTNSASGLFANAKTVTFGQYVTTVPENCFAGSPVTAIDLSMCESMITIPANAFGGCTGLTKLTLPSNLKNIEEKAFWRNSLTEVSIPGTVIFIGDNAFDVISSSNDIKKVTFEPSPKGYDMMITIVDKANFKSAKTVILNRTINENSGTTGDGDCLFAAAETVIVGEGVIVLYPILFQESDNLKVLDMTGATDLEHIADKAFYGCDGLTELTFPAALNYIGENAFYSCDGLTDVEMDACVNLKSITQNAFDECTELNHLLLPPNVETIGKAAFYRNSLTSLMVPASCTLIEEDAFDVQGENDITELYLMGSATAGELTIKDDDNFQNVTKLYLDRHLSAECDQPVFASVEFASIEGDVTHINTVPFKGSTTLKTLDLSRAIALKTIDDEAFYECYYLKGTIDFSQTVLESIGKKAFFDCNGIEWLYSAATLKSLGEACFRSCDRLATVDFSASTLLTVIPEDAFRACTDLKKLVLPPNVKTLGDGSFYNSALEEITIPASCTLIEDDAIDGLPYNNIHKVTLLGSETAEPLTVNDDASFADAEVLYLDRDLVTEDENDDLFPDLVTLTVGPHVHAINPYCFYGSYSLEAPDFSQATSLTSIGKLAFYSCCDDKFDNIDLSKCTVLTEIGDYAFEDCDDLTAITFPNSLQTIGKEAFYNDPIEAVTIPATVTHIKEDAFDYNILSESLGNLAYGGVKSATFLGAPGAAKLTNDDADCFEDATYVYLDRDITTPTESFANVESLVLGPNITTLQEYLFASSDVELIDFKEARSLVTIGKAAFGACESLLDANLSACSALTTISDEAFLSCSNLLSCTLPTSITTIGKAAFSGTGLIELNWPATVSEVSENVFFGCSNMSALTLPEGVTRIGNNAFEETRIITLTIPSTVNYIGYRAISPSSSPYILTFVGSDDAEVLNIVDCELSTSIVTLDRDLKLLSADGEEPTGKDLFKNVSMPTFGAHVTMLPDHLFDGSCIVTADLSAATALTTIGKRTFAECDDLTKVVMPASLTTIGEMAFYDCNNIMIADLSAATGLTTIASNTFYDCSALGKLLLPVGLETIGESAFNGCSSLRELALPEGLKTIDTNAFYGCTHLLQLSLGEGLETIGKSAFYRNSLTELTIPSTVIEIKEDAFDVFTTNNIAKVTLLGNKDSRNTSISIHDEDNFQNATEVILDRNISSGSSENLFESAKLITIGANVTDMNRMPFGNSSPTTLVMHSLPIITSDALPGTAKEIRLELTDESFVYTDDSEYKNYLPTFTSESYTRTMSNRWGTLLLPFAVASNDDVQFYTLNSFGYDNIDGMTLTLDEVDAIPAGTPCFFRRLTDNNEVLFTSSTKGVTSHCPLSVEMETGWEGISLVGTYTEREAIHPSDFTGKDVYYIAQDKFWHAEKDFKLPAFRAFLTMDKSSDPAQSIQIRFGNDVTAIYDLNSDMLNNLDADAIYDLQGRRLEAMPTDPGIYIVGGKKVWVK